MGGGGHMSGEKQKIARMEYFVPIYYLEICRLILSALGILLTLLSSWDETVSYGGLQVI